MSDRAGYDLAAATTRRGSTASVRAAGAAAAAGRGGVVALGAVLDLERVAAPARGGGVRVVDLEAGLLKGAEEVDRGATQVRDAERVDDDVHALEQELVVALGRLAVEAEAVLEARA